MYTYQHSSMIACFYQFLLYLASILLVLYVFHLFFKKYIQDDKGSIAAFFREKTIGLTGASGFIGQLLVEKLLRSCPGIRKIFLLLRSAKDKSCQERLQHIISLPVRIYELLRDVIALYVKVM